MKLEEKSGSRLKTGVIAICISLIAMSLSPATATRDHNDDTESVGTSVSMDYSFAEPMIHLTEIGNETYHQVVMKDVSNSGKPGEPSLPAYGVHLLLPRGTTVKDITITPGEKHLVELKYPVEPVPEPVQLSYIGPAPLPIPNKTIYSFESCFPGELSAKAMIQCFRGFTIVILRLFPVQYIPATGIIYYSDITVDVETVEDENKISSLFRGLEKDMHEAERKIDNPALVDTYKGENVGLSSLEDYDLLILTTDTLKDAFIPLADAHNTTGLSTMIKTLSAVGSDNPEDIRNFIRSEYINHHISYVLIGGDDNVVPARRLWVQSLPDDESTFMPSDLYYACLDGSYNADGDDMWGEPTDGEAGDDVDLLAEVYIGRACVGNALEVAHFVNKTITYMHADSGYLNRALMVGELLGCDCVNGDCECTWGGDYVDELIDGSYAYGYTTVGIPSSELGYNISTLYDKDDEENNWPKSEIIGHINNGTHIINHVGHANWDKNMKMTIADVDDLTNDKYCFIYSQGCNAGGFDHSDCIAECFTVKTEHCAFAGIWNARYGWAASRSTDGASQRFHREFWDAVFGENISSLGMANQDSKEDNLWRIDEPCMRWCCYELNLFGDPTLTINRPNTPSKPSGPTFGMSNNNYIYTTIAHVDQVFYNFSWDDESYSGWIGPVFLGETVRASHTWTDAGSYNVRVKARDSFGIESGWSDPLTVRILSVHQGQMPL